MEADSNIIVQSHGVFTGFDHSLQDFFRYRSRLVVTNADSPAYGRTYTHGLLFICYCNHPDPSHLPLREKQYVKSSLPWRALYQKPQFSSAFGTTASFVSKVRKVGSMPSS